MADTEEKKTDATEPKKEDIESPTTVSKLIKQYGDERDRMSKDVKMLAQIFSKAINALGEKQGEFYLTRQKLVERKFELMTYSNALNRLIVVERKKIMESYKFGLVKEPGKTTGIVPKNELERTIYMDNDNRNYNHLLKTVDDHIAFVVDTISSVDKMIYGFEHAISFSKMKQNM